MGESEGRGYLHGFPISEVLDVSRRRAVSTTRLSNLAAHQVLRRMLTLQARGRDIRPHWGVQPGQINSALRRNSKSIPEFILMGAKIHAVYIGSERDDNCLRVWVVCWSGCSVEQANSVGAAGQKGKRTMIDRRNPVDHTGAVGAGGQSDSARI